MALVMIVLSSCKKEKPDNVPNVITPPPVTPLFDSTVPPADPDFSARVATLTEPDNNGNKFTRQLFYNAAGLVDSVVCTGSKSYVQRFTHTADYTLNRFYDAAGNATGVLDSIRLNAGGYPTATYKIQQDTVWSTYMHEYDANGYLGTTYFNQYKPSRYGNTSYRGWSNGDMSSTNGGCGNWRCTDSYEYDTTKPGMTGEPEQLEMLFQIGRPVNHSAHLRISAKNAYDTDATLFVYKWANRRIVTWFPNKYSVLTEKQLTYYN